MTPPAPTGPSARAGWWERNRLALLGLLALAPLAVLSASFRYRGIYLPSTPSRLLRGAGPSHRYQGELRAGEQRIARDVTITVRGIGPGLGVQGALRPPPGAALWELQLELAASPEIPLDGCTLELVDADGRRYGPAGRRPVPGRRSQVRASCVPEEAPGPTLDFSGRLSRPADDRPPSWPVTALFALPEGATPRAVRVAWETPDVVELPLTR